MQVTPMKPIYVLFILIAGAFSLIAAAQGNNAPSSIHGLYGERTKTCFGKECEGDYADTILITPMGSEYSRVDISLMFKNGERCEVDKATGVWKDGHLVVEMEGTPACKLHLRFSHKKVVLRDDIDFPCVRLFCGFNGSLNATLPKKGSL
jgi:hypothetical protein